MKKLENRIFLSTLCMLPGLFWLAACFFFVFHGSSAHAYNNYQAAEIVIGQPDMTSHEINQGGAVNGRTLNFPGSVLLMENRLLIADRYNHRILIYNHVPTAGNAAADLVIGQPDLVHNTQNQNTTPSARTLAGPVGMCSVGGKLVVADLDNHRVLIYNTLPTVNNAAANIVIGQATMQDADPNRGGPPAANTLHAPHDVHTDGQHLLVADFWNNRVLIFNTLPLADGAAADVVIGQPDMASGGENQWDAPGAQTLFHPDALETDRQRLLISDFSNNRVLIYNTIPTANNAAADVVIGQKDMFSVEENQGGPTAANTLSGPNGLAVQDGSLFVSEASSNERVLLFNSIPTANNPSADVVIGQPDMTHQGDSPASARTLSVPFFPMNTGSQLFLTDAGNHRVLIFNEPVSVPPIDFSAGVFQVIHSRIRPAQGEFGRMRLNLQTAGKVTLCIYDLAGRNVATLVEQTLAPGRHEFVWAAENAGSGTYIVQCEAGTARAQEKLVVIR